jgi:Yip1-like protein
MESAAEPAPPPGPDSAFGRLVGVFVSPVKTFAAIARKPTWLLPVAIGAGVGLPLSELILSKTDWRAVMTRSLAKSQRKLTESQMEAAIEQARKLSWLWDVVAVLAPLLIALAVAGILWVACQAFGWDVKFRQSLGVTAHAFLPATLGSIALLVVLWNRVSLDPQLVGDALRTNPGFLVDRETNSVLHGLLASLDLFSFWTMALLVLGLSAAAGAPRGRVAVLVGSLWALFVLGKAGVTTLF